MTDKAFATEADLVAAFCAEIERLNGHTHYHHTTWRIYHETCGWDLLLVDAETGVQIGIEAKLTLNAKVLEQALPKYRDETEGPDYRAVLVASTGLQNHLSTLAHYLGITVIRFRMEESGAPGDRWHSRTVNMNPGMPDEEGGMYSLHDWASWLPIKRCVLPDYVPDVMGGKAAPVMLTHWKIQAIKLLILLDRRGAVTRADIKALKLSPTRFTDPYNGFLARGDGAYLRCGRTPDLKAQHPTNWAQIEADFDKWAPPVSLPANLFAESAA